MAEVLFQSDHSGLTVARVFPGNVQSYVGLSFKGEPQMKPPITFKDGFAKFDDEKDADVIEILEKHLGNESNGGNSFRKVKSDVLSMLAVQEGKTYAETPAGGLEESDKENLQYLHALPAAMPPNTKNLAFEKAINVYERFKVVGVPRPVLEHTQKRLRARITDIVATIEEQGIWNDNSNGQESTGSGTDKDQG